MVDTLDTAGAASWITAFSGAVESHADELTDLDRRCGDGDFGANARSAVGQARTALADRRPASVGEVFDAVSAAFLGIGGTSGPLFGMWFREFAKVSADRESVDLQELSGAAEAGLAAVQRLGGASVGDKTMVDAMAPAVDALASTRDGGQGLAAALTAAAAAARGGAESTAELVARRGRASYVGEVARGVLDPGAVTVALFFEASPGSQPEMSPAR